MLGLNPESLKGILEECLGNAGRVGAEDDNKEGTEENEDAEENQMFGEPMNVGNGGNE